MKKRGFEVVSAFANDGINVPKRNTKQAAGYDFEAAKDIEIPSIWATGLKSGWTAMAALLQSNEKIEGIKPTLVPTGIKAYMQEDEYLQLANRSGNPMKKFLLLANGIGVIDADYYNNDDNEGHIMFQFINFGFATAHIKKGERIGQGIFLPFLKADNDEADGERVGGFGSTGH